jgi:hypothetical protein
MDNSDVVLRLVREEISRFERRDLVETVGQFVVQPYCQNRRWNYGTPGQTFPCWIVVDPPSSNVGIAYCEFGFGPKAPWGLLFLSGGSNDMGADSGWFVSLEDAAADLFGDMPSNPRLERP